MVRKPKSRRNRKMFAQRHAGLIGLGTGVAASTVGQGMTLGLINRRFSNRVYRRPAAAPLEKILGSSSSSSNPAVVRRAREVRREYSKLLRYYLKGSGSGASPFKETGIKKFRIIKSPIPMAPAFTSPSYRTADIEKLFSGTGNVSQRTFIRKQLYASWKYKPRKAVVATNVFDPDTLAHELGHIKQFTRRGMLARLHLARNLALKAPLLGAGLLYASRHSKRLSEKTKGRMRKAAGAITAAGLGGAGYIYATEQGASLRGAKYIRKALGRRMSADVLIKAPIAQTLTLAAPAAALAAYYLASRNKKRRGRKKR